MSSLSWVSSFILVTCTLVGIGCALTSEEIASLTNDFTVQFREFDPTVAELVAAAHGLRVVRAVEEFANIYHFEHVESSKRDIGDVLELLNAHPKIEWAQRQMYVHREKREITKEMAREDRKRSAERKSSKESQNARQIARETIMKFNDSMYGYQWYLENTGTLKGNPGFDINVVPVWQKNITGYGVKVIIIDDGLDYRHPDLVENFCLEISYNMNNESMGNDPMADNSDPAVDNAHGTKCAGEVAAKANNGICGVGIAFHVSIGGVRLLDGKVTDLLEARGIARSNDKADVKSASWGPKDNGETMEQVPSLTREALERGVQEGRDGKGVIFVWASGNGGNNGDDCGADGYVSSHYVISIGSVNSDGLDPYFLEFCPATMAVVPSGGTHQGIAEEGPPIRVVTTGIGVECVTNFQGTSSAAPIAAGIFALVIQSNSNLTYRDVMYLVTLTSKVTAIDEDKSGWWNNGAGYHVSDKFGFGVLDTARLVEAAQTWVNVGPQSQCVIDVKDPQKSLRPGKVVSYNIDVDSCPGVESLEHVILNASYQYSRRGDVMIVLISPAGMRSELLSYRPRDDSDSKVDHFPFMSTFHWGESPTGRWIAEFHVKDDNGDDDDDKNEKKEGRVMDLSLVLFGTIGEHRKRDVTGLRSTSNAHELSKRELQVIALKEKQQARSTEIRSLGAPIESEKKASEQRDNDKKQGGDSSSSSSSHHLSEERREQLTQMERVLKELLKEMKSSSEEKRGSELDLLERNIDEIEQRG